jgi:hypothetical protein
MTSLALPAAMATAGLLNAAEAAYASSVVDKDVSAGTHEKADQSNGPVCPPVGNLTFVDYGNGNCCPPVGNVTIVDYGTGHCCPPVGNVTIVDYGNWHCPPVGNSVFFDYSQQQIHQFERLEEAVKSVVD